jgi:ubiquitin-protein ligase E3 A
MRAQREEALRQLFMGMGAQVPILGVKVRRSNLIEDSLTELSKYDPEDLKKELRVKFVGEEAIDEGGVQKEWFQLIVREIFDPKYGRL